MQVNEKYKEANRKRAKEYYYQHREEKLNYQKQYREKNREKVNESSKKSKLKNKNHYDEIYKKYNEEHKEELKEKRHQYYLKNKDRIKERVKQYRINNPEKIKEYNSSHKEEKNIYDNNYRKKRAKKDNIFKLKIQTRKMIVNSFIKKGLVKSKKCEEILGISLIEFYKYLLQTYKNNYGYEWDGIEKVHIDHIIPLKEAKTENDVVRLCHYKNLQLLKAKDNLEKSDKLNWSLEERNVK